MPMVRTCSQLWIIGATTSGWCYTLGGASIQSQKDFDLALHQGGYREEG